MSLHILYVILKIIAIQRIDNIEQSSKIDFYLGLLSENSSIPMYEFVNSNDYMLVNEISFIYDKAPSFAPVINNSTWTYVERRIVGTFQSEINLKNFPFDTQNIGIILEPLDDSIDELIISPIQLELLSSITSSLPDWHVNSIESENLVQNYQPYNENYSRVVISINVKRNSGFYMSRIVIGLILLVIMGILLHLIDIDNGELRIGGSFTVYLTMTAYLLVVSSDVPKISYTTNLDSFILGSQIIIFWMIILNISICSMLSDGISDKSMRKKFEADHLEINSSLFIRYRCCNPIIINRISMATTSIMYIIVCGIYLN
jgi:hypothetical protein